MSNHPIDPTGALTGEPGFPPGDVEEGPLPQRELGATLDAADQAQLIANREHMRAAYERRGDQ